MKCRNCQYENPAGMKFCNQCGTKLEVVCPHCAQPTLPGSKFCGECGQSLTSPASTALPKDLSFDEKLAKIQKYLPGGLTEKILSQRDRIEGERRHVTIMFVDMKGFTPLTEKLGPEETFGLMDKVFELLIHKVHEYEGTVNEMRGDGVLAFFGAPIALEDAPQRAIRSSLAIHRELTRFNDKLKMEKNIPPVLVRIGINSGPVVVGTVGNDLRVQFTAVGDTINMAARMEQLAEPGTTYVTEDTFKLTEGFFRFEALGHKEIKGKEKPMRVYRVIAPSSRRTRFEVSAESGLTPLVARDREIELLLDGFERVKGGYGKAFSIVGEAGVGKSRLLYEFRKAVANEYVTFLEGKCLSYGRGATYHPIVDILKSNFDVKDGDGDREVREKVEKGLKTIGADEASTLPYILELLSIKESGIEKISTSPEGKKDRTIEALKAIVLRGAEIRPLILAIEDLHWIDVSSEEALKRLVEAIPGSRVLMLFTYRPEYARTWGIKSFHTQLTLNRFSERDSRLMVSHLLGNEATEEKLEELVIEKTEGVPFFIEEFVSSLKELKLIEIKYSRWRFAPDTEALAIPSTIQDVIMARVDSLPEGAKEVLQTGSVIEREFAYELIRRVAGLTEQELLAHLSILRDSELLYERGIYPQSSYIFKHALTRDVLHDSILTEKKGNLHQLIARAIEDLYREHIDEHFGTLAGHYAEGGVYERAAQYLKLAAQKAEKAGSLNDAIAYSRKRVTALERLPATEQVQQQIIDARTDLGLYLLQMLHYIEAKQAITPVVDIAFQSKNRLAQILTIIGTYVFNVEEDVPGAFKYMEEALRISQEQNDLASLLPALYRHGLSLCMNCEFEKASRQFERALGIVEKANNHWAMSRTKSYLSFFCYFSWGKIDLAWRIGHEAIQLAEDSGDMYSRAMAYISRGIAAYGKGFFAEAIENLLKGVSFCESLNYVIWNAIGHWFLGETYCETGEYKNSRDSYEITAQLLNQSNSFFSFNDQMKMGEILANVLMHKDQGVDLRLLYQWVDNTKLRLSEAGKRMYMGQILLSMNDHYLSEAQTWIRNAIEATRRNAMNWYVARNYGLLAEALRRKGDALEARENLGKAIDIYKECGADGWVTRAEEELARLS